MPQSNAEDFRKGTRQANRHATAGRGPQTGKQEAQTGNQSASTGTLASAAVRAPLKTVSWYIYDGFDGRAFHFKGLLSENRSTEHFDVSVPRWLLMRNADDAAPSSLRQFAKLQESELLKMVTTSKLSKRDPNKEVVLRSDYSFSQVTSATPLGVKQAAQEAARQTRRMGEQAIERARGQSIGSARRRAQLPVRIRRPS